MTLALLAKRIDASNVTFDTTHMSSGQRVLVACLLGAALWNSVTMIPVIFLTFKRRWTLYFWSMLTSNLGVMICATEQIVNIGIPGVDQLLIIALSSVGWVLMVTGQSLVLYSRLHMLFIGPKTLRLVLSMIIFNALVIHVTGITFSVALLYSETIVVPYSIFERVNIASFFVQETILSGLYLWKSRDLLSVYVVQNRQSTTASRNFRANFSIPIVRSILSQLIIVNIIVLCIDSTIVVLEYSGLYQLQLGYKIFAYSVKLQCEIATLNRLIEFANRTRRLRTLNSELGLSSDLQREWDSTLERAFGSSVAPNSVNTHTTDVEQVKMRPAAPHEESQISESRPVV
ncbi:hypothetical protein N0V93_008802 [Gnomoniopsis smithogilvyi]|uniref:DUF7703 domain-containing protein n=1 Tax=Gnomoniopsis smithogilvyi TaxID=1191159 RepID=A0A9W8YQP9_9PEZI|nr:hypothetical protein N0V93_008802 [Gnomoniopsis smithogilvyi]